jgi:glycosyltransferase involved in cell wall biosynthesis
MKEAAFDFLYIRHFMDGLHKSELRYYKDGNEEKCVEALFKTKNMPVLFLVQYVHSSICVALYGLTRKVDILIGNNPLNAFVGLPLRFLGFVEKVVFLSSDYSEHRFTNSLMDSSYHLVDSACSKASDYVWSVSSRIAAIRKQMGVADKKNCLLPNVPSSIYKSLRATPKDMYALISMGPIEDQLDYIGLIDALAVLIPNFPKLRLSIVGTGSKEAQLKAYVRDNHLEKTIAFLGYIDHPELMKILATCGVGLALYNGNWKFNYYGDSGKCREYAFFGLPILTTDTHSTVEDIKQTGAGYICEKPSAACYEQGLRYIFANYATLSKNSLVMSEKFEDIHRKALMQALVKAA